MILDVNGKKHRIQDTAPWESLLFVLRERVGLYGTKNACEQGECGSCSVLIDDDVLCACLVPARQVEGRRVTTIEGLDEDEVGDIVRRSLQKSGGVQCGFCTPGFVVAASGLLMNEPCASTDRIREVLAGNLCRCTGYQKILQAVEDARDAVCKSSTQAQDPS